jgi:hypothetical protein
MLELGNAGAHGYPKGELPVVRDGGAVLHATSREDAPTAEGATAAVIGGTS